MITGCVVKGKPLTIPAAFVVKPILLATGGTYSNAPILGMVAERETPL